jgi:hypothetical protein
MAEYYARKEIFTKKAVMHFQMALSIYEKRLPMAHQDLLEIKNKISYLKNRQQLQTFSKTFKQFFLQISIYKHFIIELFYITIDNIRRTF